MQVYCNPSFFFFTFTIIFINISPLPSFCLFSFHNTYFIAVRVSTLFIVVSLSHLVTFASLSREKTLIDYRALKKGKGEVESVQKGICSQYSFYAITTR